MQYVPELTWILFLRILDEREAREAEEAEAMGLSFTPALAEPHRCRDWADPECARRQDTKWSVWKFVHGELLPHLKGLKDQPGATPRQKVVSQIMSSVERSRIDTEKNFLDVLDKVHELSSEAVDDTHVFTLSQVYEGLLLKMGEKGNDGGQFFTPREVIRVMVKVVKLLPARADSEQSWTVDFSARQERAAEEARPHREMEAAFTEAARALESKWQALKEAKAKPAALETAEQTWKAKVREAREAASKADGIENAVYDLKAVNSRRVVTEERRTPGQLLEEIAGHGHAVEAALVRLWRAPTQAASSPEPAFGIAGAMRP